MALKTTGRIAFAVAAVAALVATQSCRKPEAENCPPYIFCPAGWHCTARTAQCIQGLCGNGRIDGDEVCDDGGVTDGDLIDPRPCSADCRWEERCGNEHIETATGEVCDPPSATCSDDCKSSLVCGNHQVDPPNEQCDPGDDNVPLETFECDLDCTFRKCGDGRINRAAPAEQCDRMGDGVEGPDGQSPTCNWNCTASRCGDDEINPLDTRTAPGGEQCDDGDTRNGWNASCLPTCVWNVCGDAHIDRTMVNGTQDEDCDGGPADALPRVDCPYGQTSCTLCSVCKTVQGAPHYCGDGKEDAPPEVCDRGSSLNGATSCPYGTATCWLCSGDCRHEWQGTGPFCGDRNVSNDENCDNLASMSCGTCGPSGSSDQCEWVSKGPAEGELTVLTNQGLPGVTFSLAGDRSAARTVFEYVEEGGAVTTPGNVAITIGTGVNQTATHTANAIAGTSAVGIHATASGNVVSLTNRVQGISGDVPIELDPTDTTTLRVEGMAGGVGCRTDETCRFDYDCVNGNCRSNSKCN
ncbi:MAG TPA: hypothetical protein VEB43_06190 [Anaeromyxobacter sp.]|nr:hypothetical protein [Anaeromyxobacter sp.]